MAEYTAVSDLLAYQPIPQDGILTRQLYDDESMRAVMFTFSPGQCLSEHTAGTAAVMHFLSGEATVGLGGETVEARAGTWVRMAPGLRHSIKTKSAVVMLLTLFKKAIQPRQ